MFRSSMKSSSGSFFLFISLSMLLILKIIKIFKRCYHSVVVMWQHMLPHNHDGNKKINKKLPEDDLIEDRNILE
jgi:hypothetical protein